jgi:hypothetical protein
MIKVLEIKRMTILTGALTFIAAILGGPALDIYKLHKAPKIDIVYPKNNEHVSSPVKVLIKYKNLPSNHYICGFIRGTENRLEWPIISNKEIIKSKGEVEFTFDQMGSKNDIGKVFVFTAGIVNAEIYEKAKNIYEDKQENTFSHIPPNLTASAWVGIIKK